MYPKDCKFVENINLRLERRENFYRNISHGFFLVVIFVAFKLQILIKEWTQIKVNVELCETMIEFQVLRIDLLNESK